MLQETTAAEFAGVRVSPRLRVAEMLGKIVFAAVLGLIVFTAVPYGTAEAWWKALFICAVFSIAILWLVEGFLGKTWVRDGWPIILPILVLVLLSFLQTLPIVNSGVRPGLPVAAWTTISTDPYQTRFFLLQLLALALAGIFLFSYVDSERRLRIVINVIIAVAVASAVFGIIRQTTQRGVGFGLPLIARDLGYGQFVNRNHFAYLMEMGFGLTLGLILGGGIKRDRMLIYLAALLPIWTTLVLSNSRAGIIAMLAQVMFAALLIGSVVRFSNFNESTPRLLRLTRSRPMRLALLLTLVFAVILGTLWLGGDRLSTKIEGSRGDFSADISNSRLGVSRNEIWLATWKMFLANPIVGVGMGGYWSAVPAYHDASGAMTPQEAHNDYLEFLASGGVVGLAIGIWFIVAVFKRTRESLRSRSQFRRAAAFGASIALVGVAVHSLFDFGLHTIINALIFTTLIVVATSRLEVGRELVQKYE